MPNNESERLDALRRYGILDTLPEPSFDGLTELASRICGTSIALVSLVDENRQWFKSRYGLDVEETGRDISFCGHAILEPGSLMEVPDTHEDARFTNNPLVTAAPDIRFYAGMPLVSPDGFALGTLCVIDQAPKVLTPDQTRMLHLLARQVADQLERRRELLAHDEQSRVLAAIMDSVSAEIIYYDANLETRMWNSTYERNFRQSVGRSPRVGQPMLDLIHERARSTSLPPDVVADFLKERLAYHENPVGDLSVDIPDGPSLLIREAPVPGGGVVATLVDVTPMRTIERELEELARTDPLTGLANRRRFFELANEEVSRCGRYGRPMSLLALDIDHFKQVNDRHGHDVGDSVLQHVAAVALAQVRGQDLIARMGGEEFAVLLPETRLSDAVMLAERIRIAIQDTPSVTRAGEIRITLSIGVDGYRSGDKQADDALMRADALLYEAKNGGRNRVAHQAVPATDEAAPAANGSGADRPG